MNTKKWTMHNDSDDYRRYRIELEGWGIILHIDDVSDTPRANARAIAALPEIIEALKYAADMAEESAKQHRSQGDRGHADGVILIANKSRAALEKAGF